MESKIIYIASEDFHRENNKVAIGAFITESPVGPGTITDITSAGYPKVNDVAVACFVTKDGLVYQGFANHIRNLNMMGMKKALFYYQLGNAWVKEGTGDHASAMYGVPYKVGLNWKIKTFEADEVITAEELMLDREAVGETIIDVEAEEQQSVDEAMFSIDIDTDSKNELADTSEFSETTPMDTVNYLKNSSTDKETEIFINALIEGQKERDEKRKAHAEELCNTISQGLLVPGNAELTEENYKRTLTAWLVTLMQENANSDFYEGLLVDIGKLFGDEAKKNDDGEVTDTMFKSKVPDLVKELYYNHYPEKKPKESNETV